MQCWPVSARSGLTNTTAKIEKVKDLALALICLISVCSQWLRVLSRTSRQKNNSTKHFSFVDNYCCCDWCYRWTSSSPTSPTSALALATAGTSTENTRKHSAKCLQALSENWEHLLPCLTLLYFISCTNEMTATLIQTALFRCFIAFKAHLHFVITCAPDMLH